MYLIWLNRQSLQGRNCLLICRCSALHSKSLTQWSLQTLEQQQRSGLWELGERLRPVYDFHWHSRFPLTFIYSLCISLFLKYRQT